MNPTPPEILARARSMLAEGMSYRMVAPMVGVHRITLMRRLPGYGMSKSDAASVGRVNRRLNDVCHRR